ncbi:MAG: hypothetical protein AAFR69_04375 [Pseudomonadota bacterium]
MTLLRGALRRYCRRISNRTVLEIDVKGFIGIVCGLKSEENAVLKASDSDPRLAIGVSGANAARAVAIATQFCQGGARMIISVGVSGGLDPTLSPGDLVIGKSVITKAGDAFDCDRSSAEALTQVLADRIKPSVIYGADEVILNASDKASIFTETTATSVDMESHGVARAAQSAGVPFAAIRAIADPADRTLPPAALNAVNDDGSTKVFTTLANAARDPAQFPALMQLGKDSGKALTTLRGELGGLLGALFLCSDLV